MITPYDLSNDHNDHRWWKIFVSGATAGLVSKTCTAPIDRVVVHLQVKGRTEPKMRKVVARIFKEEGVLAFWRGNQINLIKVIIETSLKFSIIDKFRSWGQSSFSSFLSGSVGGAFSQTIVYPLDVIRTNAIVLGKNFKGMVLVTRYIYGQKGIRGFFSGCTVNALGAIPYEGINLGVYQSLKRRIVGESPKSDTHPAVLFFCGIVSSAASQLSTYPLALIRTKIQAEVGRRSMVQLMKDITLAEGPTGFYHGLLSNLFKTVPGVAISFLVFEETKGWLTGEQI